MSDLAQRPRPNPANPLSIPLPAAIHPPTSLDLIHIPTAQPVALPCAKSLGPVQVLAGAMRVALGYFRDLDCDKNTRTSSTDAPREEDASGCSQLSGLANSLDSAA
ncbi:hypothetical protein CCM_00574 [Cordyceps militaris CM01]|uniref:Uncharacterized protein n=1 Tax=Cordyceps militaris (strain CM01) TaxID=983644 RepID=G3J4V3_CORMM|nr:uncharacterized protein CCM_00574 [Cordyceps militaris CM01]EGX95920.1 hypothetical protein CCM_00574 [Cordyceps militaris CM01]